MHLPWSVGYLVVSTIIACLKKSRGSATFLILLDLGEIMIMFFLSMQSTNSCFPTNFLHFSLFKAILAVLVNIPSFPHYRGGRQIGNGWSIPGRKPKLKVNRTTLRYISGWPSCAQSAEMKNAFSQKMLSEDHIKIQGSETVQYTLTKSTFKVGAKFYSNL